MEVLCDKKGQTKHNTIILITMSIFKLATTIHQKLTIAMVNRHMMFRDHLLNQCSLEIGY